MKVYPLLVLGAGPVGCAAGHVLNAPVLGEVLGGHLDGPPAGPFLLWRTPAVARYLEALNLPLVEAVSRFGYLRAGTYSEDSPSRAEREFYYRRSRGLPRTARVPTSAMSSGADGALPVYAAAREALRERMTRAVTHLKGRIVRLEAVGGDGEPFWKVHLEDGFVAARRILSTLPAPVFYRLAPVPTLTPDPVFESRPKTFLIPSAPRLPYLPEGVDYAYTLDGSLPFDRVTAAGEREVLEFNDTVLATEFLHAQSGAWERLTNPFGQVISRPRGPAAFPLPARVPAAQFVNVNFVGRLARWQHGERLHTALEDLYRLRG